jgi:hypothetical protein
MPDHVATVIRSGGAIVGGVRMTWPMGTLTATRSSFRIDTVFGGKYEFQLRDVSLKRRWRYLWPCIQVEHRRSDIPRDLCFMPWFRPTLVRELKNLGYRVR